VGLKPEDYLVEGREQKHVPGIEVNGAPVTPTSPTMPAGGATGVETSTKKPKSRKQKS